MEARGLLIDTSALIGHFRETLALQDLVGAYAVLYVSSVTLYEVEYGARRAGRLSDWQQLQAAFRPDILGLGPAEALQAELNAALARENQRIGDRDALIAGTAVVHGLDVATLDLGEFRRVPGLRIIPEPPDPR